MGKFHALILSLSLSLLLSPLPISLAFPSFLVCGHHVTRFQAKPNNPLSFYQDLHLDLDSLQKPRRRLEDKPEAALVKRGNSEVRGGQQPRDYAEEMQIVREAIASLRSMFR